MATIDTRSHELLRVAFCTSSFELCKGRVTRSANALVGLKVQHITLVTP